MTIETKVNSNLRSDRFTDVELDLINKAAEAGRLAESEVEEAEAKATVSQNFVNKLIESGITRANLPQEYGGPKISLRALGEIVRNIAYYNISASWVGYFYPLHNSLAAFLPQEGRDEIASGNNLIADVFPPIGQVEVVDGGIRLSGTYHWCSGVNHANWVGLGAVAQLPESNKPEFIMGIMKKEEVEVLDNWNPFGLRGSGSNSVVVNDVFIPRRRIVRLEVVADGTRRPPEGSNYDSTYPFYHVPYFSAFYSGFPNMALGGARRLIDEFKERTEKRVRMINGQSEKESPRAQRVLAEITLMYKKAEGLLEQYYQMLETFETEEPYPRGEFQAVRADIIKACTDIAVRVLTTLGGAAMNKGSTVEIMLRDMLAISTHTTSLYEDAIYSYGRNLFGYDGIGWG